MYNIRTVYDVYFKVNIIVYLCFIISTYIVIYIRIRYIHCVYILVIIEVNYHKMKLYQIEQI